MQTDLTGQQLGNYTLSRLLGQGGMGAVYASYQESVKREVAIKVLPAQLASQPGYLDRFNREVELAASLEHPHILPVYDYGTDQGMSYIVMRYLRGSDLQHRLRKLGRPPIPIAQKLLEQIASALDYAHGRGVIHRDLKTNNIMFDEGGNAYLVDFGIAKLIGANTGLTGTGQAIGTPAYMAPEQWQGGEVDARTDIYAFGVMTYYLLSGQMPFDAETPAIMMFKHISEAPIPLTSVQSHVSASVEGVIEKALAKDPSDRYPSAGQFIRALGRALSDATPDDSSLRQNFMTIQIDTGDTGRPYTPATPRTPSGPRPRTGGSTVLESDIAPPRPERNNTPLLIGAAVLILAVLGIIGFLAMSGGGDEDSGNNLSAADIEATTTAIYEAAQTDIAAAVETNTPTEEPDEEPTETPTFTEREIAEATLTAFVTETEAALAQQENEVAIQAEMTNIANEAETATAEQWTDTPTATNTNTATNTPTNTATNTPTNTPIPPILGTILVETGAIARTSLDTSGDSIEIDSGEYPIIGIDDSETFFEVLYNDQSYWIRVSSPDIRLELEDETLIAAVYSPTPTNTPTDTPTNTPTPTATATDESTLGTLIVDGRTVFRTSPTTLGGNSVSSGEYPIIGLDESGELYEVLYEGESWWVRMSSPNIRVEMGDDAATNQDDETEVATSIEPVTRNDDWTPVIEEFDGVEMVLVPPGCFDMGSDSSSDEQPVHEQCFDEPFWIDRTEVTQSDFERLGGTNNGGSRYDGEDRPEESLKWFDARDYCENRGEDVRLPTEREWEYAARGVESWIYPWGDEFIRDNVVFSGNSGNQTAEVGSRPDGASWVGALDMSGNVWEWVSSIYEDYPYRADDGREDASVTNSFRVLRGGSFSDTVNYLRAANRFDRIPGGTDYNFGFRCARSY